MHSASPLLISYSYLFVHSLQVKPCSYSIRPWTNTVACPGYLVVSWAVGLRRVPAPLPCAPLCACMRAFDFIFGASISERSCCRYLQMCELVKTDVAVSSCPTPSAGGGAGALSSPHRVSQRQGQSPRGGPQPKYSSGMLFSECCSGGANRRMGSWRAGRGPWAVGGGVWLRSPQLRGQCRGQR